MVCDKSLCIKHATLAASVLLHSILTNSTFLPSAYLVASLWLTQCQYLNFSLFIFTKQLYFHSRQRSYFPRFHVSFVRFLISCSFLVEFINPGIVVPSFCYHLSCFDPFPSGVVYNNATIFDDRSKSFPFSFLSNFLSRLYVHFFLGKVVVCINLCSPKFVSTFHHYHLFFPIFLSCYHHSWLDYLRACCFKIFFSCMNSSKPTF